MPANLLNFDESQDFLPAYGWAMLTQSGAPSKLRLSRGFDSGVVLNPGAPVRCPQLETGADLPNYNVMNWDTHPSAA
jgi:hypothetical protein